MIGQMPKAASRLLLLCFWPSLHINEFWTRNILREGVEGTNQKPSNGPTADKPTSRIYWEMKKEGKFFGSNGRDIFYNRKMEETAARESMKEIKEITNRLIIKKSIDAKFLFFFVPLQIAISLLWFGDAVCFE
jgi:hypothetical protein